MKKDVCNLSLIYLIRDRKLFTLSPTQQVQPYISIFSESFFSKKFVFHLLFVAAHGQIAELPQDSLHCLPDEE